MYIAKIVYCTYKSKMSSKQSYMLFSHFMLLANLIICDGVRENVSVSQSSVIDVSMPNVRPTQVTTQYFKDDHYLCTAKDITSLGTQYVHEFEPNSNADRAHHMLLFTCDDVHEELTKDGWWDCGHHYQACKTMRIVYAWAKNAPPTVMPQDVGFRIGVESNIKFLVLQVHYAHPLPEGQTDSSGFKIHVSPEETRFLAGVMLMYRSYLRIPPLKEKIHGDMNCALYSVRPIHPFAFRVHTHKLGSVVSGYVIDKTGSTTELGKGNPQWPQAFYPLKKNITINPMDQILARCTFTTTNFERFTQIGQTAGDEMCNLYIMFYTKSRDPEDHYLTCGDEENPQLRKLFPVDSDVPLPRNKTLEEHAKGSHTTIVKKPSVEDAYNFAKTKGHARKRPGIDFKSYLHSDPIDGISTYPGNDYSEDISGDGNRVGADRQLPESTYAAAVWPDAEVKLGQASGVDFDTHGNVVVFHRVDRVWGHNTFDNLNRYTQRSLGPISKDTVYIIDPTSGKLLHQWGKDMFYMPHDITVDKVGNFWLTDVALHQVFKFEPGSTAPSLVLGKEFEPGSDDDHFCKPAAVAVMSTGDFFVADGYCNTRIIKFDSTGRKMMQFGRGFTPNLIQTFLNNRPPPFAFSVPHALALAEDKNLICVADRENGRIQCFSASNGTCAFMVESPAFNGRLFSVSYSDVDGGTLYAVNGPGRRKVQGFIIPLRTRTKSGVFSPNNEGFTQPHDIAVTHNGSAVYVVEISRPYKVWKFEKDPSNRQGKDDSYHNQPFVQSSDPVQNTLGPKEPEKIGAPNPHQSDVNNQHVHSSVLSSDSYLPKESQTEDIADESFSASVIIMAFLTIPLLLLIGIGALLRLRNNVWFSPELFLFKINANELKISIIPLGCCRRKETKSFAEFFPPSAGFEKLRMEESESENSDTEVEEFTVSSYRKTSA